MFNINSDSPSAKSDGVRWVSTNIETIRANTHGNYIIKFMISDLEWLTTGLFQMYDYNANYNK